jgi:hypothetical protein
MLVKTRGVYAGSRGVHRAGGGFSPFLPPTPHPCGLRNYYPQSVLKKENPCGAPGGGCWLCGASEKIERGIASIPRSKTARNMTLYLNRHHKKPNCSHYTKIFTN